MRESFLRPSRYLLQGHGRVLQHSPGVLLRRRGTQGGLLLEPYICTGEKVPGGPHGGRRVGLEVQAAGAPVRSQDRVPSGAVYRKSVRTFFDAF